MEALNKGRKQYISCYNYQTSRLDEDNKKERKKDIHRFINIALKEAPLKTLFAHGFILTSLQEALERCSDHSRDIGPVTRAFDSVERYLTLLVEQPWKPEYKRLKMYGGFFKTRISSVLPGAEEIFLSAGYSFSQDLQLLIHKGSVDKDSLLSLAFDCRIASVQCRTVAESYKKLRNIGQSYSEVISKAFKDVSIRDKPYPSSSSSYEKKSMSAPVRGKVSVAAANIPPAIPKREPLVNGRGACETSSMVYEASTCSTGILIPGLPGAESSHTSSSHKSRVGTAPDKVVDTGFDLVKSPLMYTGPPSQEAFPYMDGESEEIIPELPEGTCDDHQRESLKHLQNDPPYKAEPQDNWKWFHELKASGGIMDPRQANTVPVSQTIHTPMSTTQTAQHALRAQTYPPHSANRGPVAPALISFDEGIQEDMSSRQTSNSYLAHQAMSARPASSRKPMTPTHSQLGSGIDTGYTTGSTNTSHYIYKPPPRPLTATGPPLANYPSASVPYASSSSTPVMSSYPGPIPPPIPSRALKPTRVAVPQVKMEDYTDGEIPPSYEESQVMSAVPEFLRPQPPQPSCAEPTLRRDRGGPIGKSSSLKMADEGSAAARRSAQATRSTRSMDLTSASWICQECTAINMDADTVCSVCANSRSSVSVSADNEPVCGKTMKACPKCTFENQSSKAYCIMCNSKLEDRFTYV